jgi:PadR family transcriptional regulator PadR
LNMTTPSERFGKSLTKDNLWIYILTLLREGEMYPYEIRSSIEGRFGFSPGNVTAYIVLKKLKAGGFVKVVKRGKSGGPERTYYAITEKGADELKKAAGLYRTILRRVF